MKATEILMGEHRLIEQVLDSLEDAAGRLEDSEMIGADMLEDGEKIGADFFIDAAQFIAEFADGSHHRKEEDILFVAMTAKGMPADSGPVAVMLHEHEQGRQYTAGFRSAAEQMKSGDDCAAPQVIQNVYDYVNLLRDHILKEDNVLYPMAEQILTAEEMQDVTQQCERIVAEDEASGRHSRHQALVDKLTST